MCESYKLHVTATGSTDTLVRSKILLLLHPLGCLSSSLVGRHIHRAWSSRTALLSTISSLIKEAGPARDILCIVNSPV